MHARSGGGWGPVHFPHFPVYQGHFCSPLAEGSFWLLITFYGMQEEGGCLAEIIPLNLQLGCLSPFHFSVHTGRPRRVA